jgi:hypothetical protein
MSDAVVEECGKLEKVECLPKPFKVARLLDAVARLGAEEDAVANLLLQGQSKD